MVEYNLILAEKVMWGASFDNGERLKEGGRERGIDKGPLVSLTWTVGMRRKKSQTWTTCLSNMVGCCPFEIFFDINKILSSHRTP